MENDELIYTIIKTAVQKGIKYIEDNPKRGIRNLVDLGEHCATGRFQKVFFDIAHDILTNDHSSYYEIIEKAVKNVNHDTLINFGINLGYNSWTKGANIIRQHEQCYGYSIPWTIVFDFEKKAENQLSCEEICNLISCGKKTGIYCYMFMINGNKKSFDNIVPAIKKHHDCAFILYINPCIITCDITEFLNNQHNVSVSVLIDDIEKEKNRKLIFEKTNLLLKSNCLFGVYKYYDNNFNWKISNGELDEQIINTQCNYLLLIRKCDCINKKSGEIGEYVKNARMKNNYPVFMMDFYEDIADIDRNISVESCFLSIDSAGQAAVSTLYNNKTPYNIRTSTLEQILEHTMPKIKYLNKTVNPID